MDNHIAPDEILELVICDATNKNVLNSISVSYCKFLVQIYANNEVG